MAVIADKVKAFGDAWRTAALHHFRDKDDAFTYKDRCIMDLAVRHGKIAFAGIPIVERTEMMSERNS